MGARVLVWTVALAVLPWACAPEVPPELRPDEVLRTEVGLGDDDEVHRVGLAGGTGERVVPREVVVPPGAWVEFVSEDWSVHEVRFHLDSLAPDAVAFVSGSDQAASPPLVERGARFVVGFAGAPPGRYPFVVEGNGEPAHGAVIVRSPR